MRFPAAILLSTIACAQAPRTFDAVSIKPQPFTGKPGEYVGITVMGKTLLAEHMSLNDLVLFAYNLRPTQLSGGPSWAARGVLQNSELFQVIAKAGDPPPTREVFAQMLQVALADRFRLQVHHVQKDFPVYNLAVAKGGPKLTPSAPGAKFNTSASARGRFGVYLAATKMSIPRLVELELNTYAARPVFDKTGLTGDYDFTLDFVGENIPLGQEDPTADVPPLADALQQQLGLKLEPSTASFDTVVIDHAERPSPN